MRTWRMLTVAGIGLLAMVGCGQKAATVAQVPCETTDRAVVASRVADGSVYVGWRLLPGDKAGAGFNVYRQAGGGVPALVNDKPITHSTNLMDNKAPATGSVKYIVEAVSSGQRSRPVAAVGAGEPAVRIMLADPKATLARSTAVGDLDGDGRLDYVVKTPGVNVDPVARSPKKTDTTFKLEAYNADGRFMWRYDMGYAIVTGTWFGPFVVYDVDGDGKAEVYAKAGEGDPREADGRVRSGPEYLVKIDGMSGKIVAKRPWPDRSGWENEKNTPERDNTYNFSNRNELAIAYLDGKHPALIVERGTYTQIKMEALDGQLKPIWTWWTEKEAHPEVYRGQGAHTIRVADVDGDGCDEIVYGAACIDHNGKGMWSTQLRHPDCVYITDFDPSNPGLEIVYGQESKMDKNGLNVVDAKTGKIIRGFPRPTVHIGEGQGIFADVSGEFAGPVFAASENGGRGSEYRAFDCLSGKEINPAGLTGKPVWWDGDDYKELTSGSIHKYKGQPIQKIDGKVSIVGDFLGDWREEVVTYVPGEVLIYSTNIPAANRKPWLMSDHQYRMQTAANSMGYYYAAQLSKTPVPQLEAKAATQPAKAAAK